VCGSIEPITLNQRIFKCSCGFEESRDLKAAKTILFMGQKNHDGVTDHNYIPVEKNSDFRASKASSMKQEAKVL
jgi:transposase